ncbi:MAG: hypothetical protein M1828_007596 [Chrysothrix sp. TS-e1954]|nr:MAG: hypothetical protein M1828_007596 [Chrysothrix sp. TS-e1954]
MQLIESIGASFTTDELSTSDLIISPIHEGHTAKAATAQSQGQWTLVLRVNDQEGLDDLTERLSEVELARRRPSSLRLRNGRPYTPAIPSPLRRTSFPGDESVPEDIAVEVPAESQQSENTGVPITADAAIAATSPDQVNDSDPSGAPTETVSSTQGTKRSADDEAGFPTPKKRRSKAERPVAEATRSSKRVQKRKKAEIAASTSVESIMPAPAQRSRTTTAKPTPAVVDAAAPVSTEGAQTAIPAVPKRGRPPGKGRGQGVKSADKSISAPQPDVVRAITNPGLQGWSSVTARDIDPRAAAKSRAKTFHKVDPKFDGRRLEPARAGDTITPIPTDQCDHVCRQVHVRDRGLVRQAIRPFEAYCQHCLRLFNEPPALNDVIVQIRHDLTARDEGQEVPPDFAMSQLPASDLETPEKSGDISSAIDAKSDSLAPIVASKALAAVSVAQLPLLPLQASESNGKRHRNESAAAIADEHAKNEAKLVSQGFDVALRQASQKSNQLEVLKQENEQMFENVMSLDKVPAPVKPTSAQGSSLAVARAADLHAAMGAVNAARGKGKVEAGSSDDEDMPPTDAATQPSTKSERPCEKRLLSDIYGHGQEAKAVTLETPAISEGVQGTVVENGTAAAPASPKRDREHDEENDPRPPAPKSIKCVDGGRGR